MTSKFTPYYSQIFIRCNLDEVFIISPSLFTNSHHSLMRKKLIAQWSSIG